MSLLRSSIQKALSFTNAFTRLQIASQQTRDFKRWVAPTLRELRKRAKKMALEDIPQPRSGFVEWNYRAELFAFGKRLQEEFQLPLLQTAFTDRSYILKEQKRQQEVGIEEVDLQMTDNAELAELGADLVKGYVKGFLQYSLPKLPDEGREAIAKYLLSTERLAYVASHLGMKDLIFSAEYPPAEECFAQSLFAVIGALEESSGAERCFAFIRDFICTQLNQIDLLELWKIENPEELLKKVCAERNLGVLEPRLIGDCGKNTVLAAYHVGIYNNSKRMLGKGYGEDIPTAIKSASLDALQNIFDIADNMRPINYKLQVEQKKVRG